MRVSRISKQQNMDDLEKKKKTRKYHRVATTKLLNKIQAELDKQPDDVDYRRLRVLRKDLNEKADTLKSLDNGISELTIEHCDEDVCVKEAEESTEYKEKVMYTIFTLEDTFKEKNGSHSSGGSQASIEGSQASVKDSLASGESGSMNRSVSKESLASFTSSNEQPQQASSRRVKLPKLELRKFNGKIEEWPEFWDSFCSAIHHDQQLAKVDKFKYLRSYLEGPARSVVKGFSLTDADYDEAVTLLRKRFERPDVIRIAHINELINLSPVFNEKNVQRLRALHDEIETHFRAMEAQDVDKQSYSSVVVPMLMSKIPESIRNNMIRFNDDHMVWMLDDFLSALENELRVLEGHVPILQMAKQQKPEQHSNQYRSSNIQMKQIGTASALLTGQRGTEKNCTFCLKAHSSENCEEVKGINDRKNVLLRNAKCFSCLKSGHRAFQCRSRIACRNCKMVGHHVSICPSLCNPIAAQPAQPKLSVPPPSSGTLLNPSAPSWVGNTDSSEGKVALQTALAVVNGKKESRVRVLFDTGSHKSFITSEAVGKLGLKPVRREELGIKVFGSKEAVNEMRDVVKFSLSALNDVSGVTIEAFVVKDISSIPNVHVERVKRDFLHLNNVWFADVCRDNEMLEVDCLVGSDWLWSFQAGEVIRGGPKEPVAVKTSLGWVLSEPLKGKTLDSNTVCSVHICVDSKFSNQTEKQELEMLMHNLWDLDSIGIRESDKVHESVLDAITFTGNRYSVGLPWKIGHKPLPSNYNVSLLRLKSQVKKLRHSPDILEKYDALISEQVQDGIIEQVSEMEPAVKTHYLPHRAVIRENAESTKIRVVYDASCREGKSGVSLNDCLHVGPSLTPMIFDILLRFRVSPVAIVGDIEKAFLNIEIHPEDRDCLRFLWVDDIHTENPEIVVYKFRRVIFGCNASPFLLNCVLRQHIEKYKDEDPEFVDKLVSGFFVDDLVTGTKDTQDALTLYEKAKVRLKDGGFTLRKWKTNKQELAKEIAYREGELDEIENIKNEQQSFAKEALSPVVSEGGKPKVLGIIWDNIEDTLEFSLGKVGSELDSSTIVTKRSILSTLASVFDPHGLVSPVAVSAKIIFQELCKENIGWDDPLPLEKLERWKTWLQGLREANIISVPRCIFNECQGEPLKVQLHGFADASKRAYCAMIFIVVKTSMHTYVRLLSAKTRVAPLKLLTIPRLELMSARILANLMNTVLEALGQQVKIEQVKYWLDSKTALFWIQNHGEWKQFVRHRVDEILNRTRKEDWGHVPGVENPADLGSRGVSANHLKNSRLWWEGPNWLKEHESKWPKNFLLENSSEVEDERKGTNVMLTVEREKRGVSNVIQIGRYGSLLRLLRVTALVIRFIKNLKEKKAKRDINIGRLEVGEIENAEKVLIKDVQETLRERADFERLSRQLGIVNDESGLLVCQGRLANSDLDIQAKYPIILPRESLLTELIINDCHLKVHHNKLRCTLAELRSRFWVLQGRQKVKQVIGKCQVCRKLEGPYFRAPAAAPLPNFRVTESKPFTNVGIDFAGPLFVKSEDGKMPKAYITLFTCSATRAIHLELVPDLNTYTFLNCFRKFCARRGTPRIANSDNAKTFIAAAKLLRRLSQDDTFHTYLESHRIIWKFNLPRASWWGGYFERMVGCVKRCLRKILGTSKLSQDELSTVLVEVENTLNTRPLTYLYDELGEVLTPSHLLCGFRMSNLSENIKSEIDCNEDHNKLTRRFLYLSNRLSHFWSRWRKEYITDLREYHKENSSKVNVVAVGDLVLIHDDNVKRGLWKMGVIETLIVGQDGKIRGAAVRKAGKGKSEVITRPLQKLVPLEISEKKASNAENLEKGRERRKEGRKKLLNEEKIDVVQEESTSRLVRAAARDARWKSQLMLEPLAGSRRGECGKP